MDNHRFSIIYDQYAKRLYNYVLWMTRNRQASEDIIQALFIKVWKEHTIPIAENETAAWLFTVVRNQCLDYFRKRARQVRFRLRYLQESSPDFEEKAENKVTWEMLEYLTEEERSILYLHLRAGYSYKEIADMLHNNENAIRVRAFRALAKLRKRYFKETI